MSDRLFTQEELEDDSQELLTEQKGLIVRCKKQRDAFDSVLNNPTSDNIFDFWLNHHKRTPDLKEEEYNIWQESGRGNEYSEDIERKGIPFIQKND